MSYEFFGEHRELGSFMCVFAGQRHKPLLQDAARALGYEWLKVVLDAGMNIDMRNKDKIHNELYGLEEWLRSHGTAIEDLDYLLGCIKQVRELIDGCVNEGLGKATLG